MTDYDAKWDVAIWDHSRWDVVFSTFGQPPRRRKKEPLPQAPTPKFPYAILQIMRDYLEAKTR